MTDVIGSTPSTSTVLNSSTKARMALSSFCRCGTSASTTLIRARCAMRRTVAESTDIKSPLGLGVKQAGYSTGALAQAMRDGEPHAERKEARSSIASGALCVANAMEAGDWKQI